MTKKICIINTGGTIGMRKSDKGLRPEPGYLKQKMDEMPELSRYAEMPDYDIIEYQPLLDSSNMTPAHWLKIAQDIADNYQRYDGFVVLHGTDTMAYTASALPFMLPGLNKSVVLTGAQLPLGQVRNDARENLKTAMIFAADYCIPEVTLFFGEVLLRGCRATKLSAHKLDAFDSPNFPPLGSAETTIELFDDRIRIPEPGTDFLAIRELRPSQIATFRLFPGMSVDVLENLLRQPLRALILESFGVGNGPSDNARFLRTLENAAANGTVLVNCTQCRHGSVKQTRYATGTAMTDVGVVSGHDMTIEAALAKLHYLFSCELSVAEIRKQVSCNLVGELTEPGKNE